MGRRSMKTITIDLQSECKQEFEEVWVLGAMTSWAFAITKLTEAGIHDGAHYFMDAGVREWGRKFIERAEEVSAVPDGWQPPWKEDA